MTALTPGQVLCEAVLLAMDTEDGLTMADWGILGDVERADWEAVAIRIAARQPQPAPADGQDCAVTPGQVACETWQTLRMGVDRTGTWELLSPQQRSHWEAAAQAAIAARQPQAASEVADDPGPDADLETLADARIQIGVLQDRLAEIRSVCEHPEQVGRSSGSQIINGTYLARRLLGIIERADPSPR